MKKVVTIGAIGAATLVPGGMALAAADPEALVKTGVYRGEMKPRVAGKAPSFVTLGIRNKDVVAVAYKIAVRCADGSVRSIRGDLTPPENAISIGSRRARVNIEGSDDGGTLNLRGRFAGAEQRPRITGRVRFDYADGTMTCKAPGKRGWATFVDLWDGSNPNPDA